MTKPRRITRVPSFHGVATRAGVALLAALLGACAYDSAGIDWSADADADADPPLVVPPVAAADADVPPPPEPPGPVSFSADVLPVFERRGCVICHATGPGNDDGGLKLTGDATKIHDELAKELSLTYLSTRIDLATPAASLLLRMPLLEDPADAHPVAPFASTADADYVLLLAWITQGAPR